MAHREILTEGITNEDQEMIKKGLSEMVRDTIRQEAYQTMNESALIFGGLLALGGAWAWLRNTLRRVQNEALLEEFIAQYDPKGIIGKQLPETIRRFKLVNSLDDLEVMEKNVEKLLGQIDAMQSKVDRFVDKMVSDEKSNVDKVFLINPAKEKVSLKRFIGDFVKNSRDAFAREVELKKDELLA